MVWIRLLERFCSTWSRVKTRTWLSPGATSSFSFATRCWALAWRETPKPRLQLSTFLYTKRSLCFPSPCAQIEKVRVTSDHITTKVRKKKSATRETVVRPEFTWFTYQDKVQNRGRASEATFVQFLRQDNVLQNLAIIKSTWLASAVASNPGPHRHRICDRREEPFHEGRADRSDKGLGSRLASAASLLRRNAWQRVATGKSVSKQTWRSIYRTKTALLASFNCFEQLQPGFSSVFFFMFRLRLYYTFLIGTKYFVKPYRCSTVQNWCLTKTLQDSENNKHLVSLGRSSCGGHFRCSFW